MKRMEKIEQVLDGIIQESSPEVAGKAISEKTEAEGIKADSAIPAAGDPAKRETPAESALPAFIRGSFKDEFSAKPAEALLNLMADIHQGKPGALASTSGSNPGIMGMVSKISRQVRKDRLMEKFDDAKGMIADIEALFKDIPEIEQRPDAYEIAYKLVKAKIMEETPAKQAEPAKKSPVSEKGKAFVEGGKGTSIGAGDNELTGVQKEICSKLGISESTFRKYMKG
jgi:hypothetical protein